MSFGKRLEYFNAVISVATAGHQTMYKINLRNFNILFRKLLSNIIGPPANIFLIIIKIIKKNIYLINLLKYSYYQKISIPQHHQNQKEKSK